VVGVIPSSNRGYKMLGRETRGNEKLFVRNRTWLCEGGSKKDVASRPERKGGEREKEDRTRAIFLPDE